MNNFYIIKQHRDKRDIAIFSKETEKILKSFDNKYYQILAIISKIFDDNLGISDIGIVFNISNGEIVIRGSMMYGDMGYFDNRNTLDWVDLKEIFERNNFKYLELL